VRTDGLLKDLELYLLRTARQHDPNALYRLRTVPGIGKILSLVILYEIHDVVAERTSASSPTLHREGAVNLDKCLVQVPSGTETVKPVWQADRAAWMTRFSGASAPLEELFLPLDGRRPHKCWAAKGLRTGDGGSMQ
jgi:hypothetical protein